MSRFSASTIARLTQSRRFDRTTLAMIRLIAIRCGSGSFSSAATFSVSCQLAMRSEQPFRNDGHFPNLIEKYVTDSAVHNKRNGIGSIGRSIVILLNLKCSSRSGKLWQIFHRQLDKITSFPQDTEAPAFAGVRCSLKPHCRHKLASTHRTR